MVRAGDLPPYVPPPKNFLQTAETLAQFAVALSKLKAGQVADANIELTRDDCNALIWGFQLVRQDKGYAG